VRHGLLPLRQDRKGVTPVFAELLMVVMMLVIAASLFLMVTAFSDSAANIPPAFTLRSAGSVPATIPGYCCLNDSTVDIIATLGDPQVWGPSLEYTLVSDQTGELLLQGFLEQEPQNGSDIYLGVYQGDDNQPSIINIWYTDVDRNGIVSVSDHISLRGMSKDYHRAIFRVVGDGRTLGTQTIP
jgi:hypothetical protein